MPSEAPLTTREGVCVHGGLRRQCETCDLAERLEVLSTAMRRFRKAVHPVLRGLALNRIGVPEASRQTAQEAEADWTEYEAADAALKSLGVWS